MSMDRSDQSADDITGISNITYDVMSVMQNKLEAISAMEVYKEDAEDEGDQELHALFNDMQERDIQDVAKLKKLLIKHLGS